MMAMVRSDEEPCSSGSERGREGYESHSSQLRNHSHPRQSQRQVRASKKAKHESDSEGEAGDGAGGEGMASHPARGQYVPWTTEEDNLLRLLVPAKGKDPWTRIAAQITGRTSKACRLRWLNQLCGDLITGNFTPEEDAVILKQQKRLGNRWTAIAAMLPRRTDNSVKNRWNSSLKKRAAEAEDEAARLDSAATAQQSKQDANDSQQDAYDSQQDAPLQQDEPRQRESLLRMAGVPQMPPYEHHPQHHSLLADDPDSSGMLIYATGRVPAPPSSTALVACGAPFQLWPHMTAAEAADVIAAHGGDAVVKKLGEQFVGGAASQRPPLPASSGAMVASSPPPVTLGMGMLPQQAQAAPPLHESLSASQLASWTYPPASSAMVAGSSPPISMPIHANQPMSKLGTAGSRRTGAGAMRAKSEDLGGSLGPSPDLARLLHEHAMLQRLAMQAQVQQQQADVPAPATAAAQAATPAPADAPAETAAPARAGAPAQSKAAASLAAVFDAAMRGRSTSSILRTLQASPGSSEVLQHLLALGIGTLMTATQLRGDGAAGGGSSCMLPAAHAQIVGHPSVDALLSLHAPNQHQHQRHTTQRRRSGDDENDSPSGLGLDSPSGSLSPPSGSRSPPSMSVLLALRC
ncbi:hypothetical protein FOA52_015856 [Chlamydomonas sp. UWO 241]|nr:hypothetical protein FOA52_015856 [Chlamydomonas sp. UWO 241]